MLIKVPEGWEIPEREVTPEEVYLSRRRFLKGLGIAGAWSLGVLGGCLKWDPEPPKGTAQSNLPLSDAERAIYPANRNPAFVLDRPMTEEAVAARFNNFYEFSSSKKDVWKKVEGFITRPWQVEVTGLVEKPLAFDPDDLIKKMPMEERVYRFRCVEAWAMAVPWTGFPMKAFIDYVRPLSRARYVQFVTVRLNKSGDLFSFNYPWPYTEGLTLAEAMNPLTLLVTGIYGHPLPRQHGAPLRLVVPWKYGYKNIKSIVRIEFTDRRPATFWNTLVPEEYDFQANVNPSVPHPRWSQERERMIGSDERRPTLLYNGYGQYVAGLYT